MPKLLLAIRAQVSGNGAYDKLASIEGAANSCERLACLHTLPVPQGQSIVPDPVSRC